MEKKKYGDYYLGLDIGTDSVGWAVTSPDYQVLKFNGKAMWGSRLFPPAETAEQRRFFRIARRRLERRRQRLDLLQELFAGEMEKTDPGFFTRLREGGLHQEDKTIHQPNNLFADEKMTDAVYHRRYPTIYHLRKELMQSAEPHDIRLVYLAVHHIIKYRGHFLFGSDLQAVPSLPEILSDFSDQLEDTCGMTLRCNDTDAVYQVLTDTAPLTAKQKRLNQLFNAQDKRQKDMIRVMTGSTVALRQLFPDCEENSEEAIKIDFEGDKYDALQDELAERLGENFYILEKLKAIHDWMVLEKICPGGGSISESKVQVYEQHRQDLALLKRVIRKYFPAENNRFFHSSKTEGNYAAYIGMTRCNGKKEPVTKKADSYDRLIKMIRETIKKGDPENPDIKKLNARLDAGNFLPKSVIKDNGVIPYQLHYHELERILENASAYLPFLNEKDETGLTVRDKILQVMVFRIPYYVGPLNDRDPNGKNSWVVRKSREKIVPWNFEQVVDLDQSAQNFIRRMTSKCTYLQDEDVLPQNSLLYSRFMVLNELNNVKVNGEPLSVAEKQDIFRDLFLAQPRVTVARLTKYLNSKHGWKLGKENITGLAEDFRASMRPMLEMKKALGEYYTDETAEEFIYTSTVFGDSDKLVLSRLFARFENVLPASIIQRAASRRFSGWGRLSRAFLAELMPEKGEEKSIIEMMWETQNNLMQLLSTDYGYLEAVRSHNRAVSDDNASGYSLVKDLYVSPAVKRAIWQALCIVREIRRITGHDPKKIFVEMARGPEENKQVKESRKSNLLTLYKACQDDSRDWLSEIDSRDETEYRSDRLYLYYTQMGRCMYTGEPMDIHEIFDKNVYDIDHIYPQSKVKDDSLNNRVLVKREVNAKKTDIYPLPPEIRNQRREYWHMLLDKKLISQAKYDRLTRAQGLTEDELLGFVSRQLVETRQSTKAVAELLQRLYESEVVYVKAGNVSAFRHDYGMLKCREVNDLHHAKDAYLNIVVGNVYNTKFTHDPRNYFRESHGKDSLNRMFDYRVERAGVVAWIPTEEGSMRTVRQMMRKNNPLVTHMAYEQHGQISDTMLVKKGEWQLPQKGADMFSDPTKYGGYNSVKGTYFMLVEHTVKKKRVRSLIDMPLHLVRKAEASTAFMNQMLIEEKGLADPVVIIPKIKIGSIIEIDGFLMQITGRSNNNILYAPNMQLILGYETECYLRNIIKFLDRNAEYSRRNKDREMPIRQSDGVSSEQNLALYDTFLCKIETTAYRVRLSAQIKNLTEKRPVFAGLSILAQCRVLREMLNLFACNRMTANLSDIDLGGRVGVIGTNRCVSNYESAWLITQSVTGLFEKRINLLR